MTQNSLDPMAPIQVTQTSIKEAKPLSHKVTEKHLSSGMQHSMNLRFRRNRMIFEISGFETQHKLNYKQRKIPEKAK